MHCQVSPLSIQGVLKLFALNLVLTDLLNFYIVTKKISAWHHFCKWKFVQSILQVAVSVGTMQLTISTAIMWVTMSVVFMQVLR